MTTIASAGPRAGSATRPNSLLRLLASPAPIRVPDWVAATPSERQRGQQFAALSDDELIELHRRVGAEAFGSLLAALAPVAAAPALLLFGPESIALMLAPLSAYAATDLVRVLSDARIPEVCRALPAEQRSAVERLLRWSGESAGGNMTPSFLSLPAETTAAEAIRVLREPARDAEATAYVYLTDPAGCLTGAVSFRGLLTAPADAPLSSVSRPVMQRVDPRVDREVAAEVLRDHDLAALPVAQDGRVLGVLTAERAAEIMVSETTEDFERLGSARGIGISLKEASVWALYRSRVLWLVILVFGNIFSGAGIAHYEELIESVVALVFFLPLLIDSGGNAGSQAATLMVRGLATGDVLLRDWARMFGREFLVAGLLGGSMALAVSVIGVVRGGPEIALVVALTMVIVVIVGSVIGMSLPFLLSKLRLDPASASAPLITSICDGVGVLIYFFIASQLLL